MPGTFKSTLLGSAAAVSISLGAACALRAGSESLSWDSLAPREASLLNAARQFFEGGAGNYLWSPHLLLRADSEQGGDIDAELLQTLERTMTKDLNVGNLDRLLRDVPRTLSNQNDERRRHLLTRNDALMRAIYRGDDKAMFEAKTYTKDLKSWRAIAKKSSNASNTECFDPLSLVHRRWRGLLGRVSVEQRCVDFSKADPSDTYTVGFLTHMSAWSTDVELGGIQDETLQKQRFASFFVKGTFPYRDDGSCIMTALPFADGRTSLEIYVPKSGAKKRCKEVRGTVKSRYSYVHLPRLQLTQRVSYSDLLRPKARPLRGEQIVTFELTEVGSIPMPAPTDLSAYVLSRPRQWEDTFPNAIDATRGFSFILRDTVSGFVLLSGRSVNPQYDWQRFWAH